MPLTQVLLRRFPAAMRARILARPEFAKFAVVGGFCYLITVSVNMCLRLTFVTDNPVLALSLANVVSAIACYFMNRQWSFRTRARKQQTIEALQFFGISALSMLVNDLPLIVAHHVLEISPPHVSPMTAGISDFVSGLMLGTALAMAFRWWAFSNLVFVGRFIFPRWLRAEAI